MKRTKPIVSIVILTYNSIHDLPKCLNSIKRNTSISYEIIIVDNASTDGTKEYLQNADIDAQVILNEINEGFSSGCNQGIKAATGDYVLLLNPDTIVTKTWLKHMLIHFKDDVGAVGPISNYAGGWQGLQHHYKHLPLEQIDADTIARRVYRRNRKKSLETTVLIGFCLLIRRDVIDHIGMLDSDFFFGNEDLEYSFRLRLNGYKLIIATDVFIYHKPETLRSLESIRQSNEYSKESQKVLKAKLKDFYGKDNVPPLKEIWNMNLPEFTSHKNATLGVVIIAKNEESRIGYLLSDLRHEAIDEIVVVDTGSSDKTIQIAKAYGAVVRRFKWRDDFASARNKARDAAQSDYLLWLDADDRLAPGSLRRLANLKPQLSLDKDMGVMLKLVNRFDNKTASHAWQMRIFPNREDIKWEGKIHEQLTPSMIKAKLKIHKANIPIEHFGYFTTADRKNKAIRNLKILSKTMSNGNGSSADYYNLAASYLQLEDVDNCLKNVRKCQGKGPSEWAKYSLYLLADCYCHRGISANGHDEAIESLKAGLKSYPEDVMMLYLLGSVYQEKGDMKQALKYYNKVEKKGILTGTYPVPINLMDKIKQFKEMQCQPPFKA